MSESGSSLGSLAQTIADSNATTSIADIWGGLPAGDVRNAPLQDAIVDSILGDNIIGDHRSLDWYEQTEGSFEDDELREDFVEEEEALAQPDEVDYEPALEAFRDQKEFNEILDQAEASRNQQMAPPEITPAAIQQSIQNLDRFVVENAISDPQSAQELGLSLASAIGIQPNEVNAQALDTVLGKVMASSIEAYGACGGDLTKLEGIHPDMARAFFSEFNAAWNMDPRTEGNAAQAAQATLAGNFGFLQAVETYGIDAPLYLLNPGQGAELVVNALAQAYGCRTPIPREACLKITDPIIERWRGQLSQVLAVREAQSRSSRQAGRRPQARRFETNDELFNDPEVRERLRMERL